MGRSALYGGHAGRTSGGLPRLDLSVLQRCGCSYLEPDQREAILATPKAWGPPAAAFALRPALGSCRRAIS